MDPKRQLLQLMNPLFLIMQQPFLYFYRHVNRKSAYQSFWNFNVSAWAGAVSPTFQAWWNFLNDTEESISAFFVAFSRAKQMVIFTYCKERGNQENISSLYELLYSSGVSKQVIQGNPWLLISIFIFDYELLMRRAGFEPADPYGNGPWIHRL